LARPILTLARGEANGAHDQAHRSLLAFWRAKTCSIQARTSDETCARVVLARRFWLGYGERQGVVAGAVEDDDPVAAGPASRAKRASVPAAPIARLQLLGAEMPRNMRRACSLFLVAGTITLSIRAMNPRLPSQSRGDRMTSRRWPGLAEGDRFFRMSN